jgi:hypothetical protein
MDLSILVDFLNSQTGTWALVIAALGGLCALASAFMPVPGEQSGKVYKAVYAVVNWIGCNFGKAKNADDAAKKKV